MRTFTAPIDRVMARTVATGGGCLEFTGATNRPGGYGVVMDTEQRRSLLAHRVAWAAAHGPIPPGLWVLHHCDNPRCVNVDHLFLGTVADNNRDMAAKGRHRGQRTTECPLGHPYTPENTRLTSVGGRACRACESARRAVRRAS